MISSRRRLSGLAFGLLGTTALAACAGGKITPAVIVSDAQAVANDAAGILALGIVPAPYAAIAAMVLTGFQALLAVVSNSLTTGASTETTVIASLTSAVKTLQSDVAANSPVYTDAGLALTLLASLAANANASLQAQAEGAVGGALIAYLQLRAPAKAMFGEHASAFTGYVADAHGHIATLKAR